MKTNMARMEEKVKLDKENSLREDHFFNCFGV
jgi:hypothetical protein